VPAKLAGRYREAGWWRDESLGRVVEQGLAKAAARSFAVHSATRPWRGTFGDVDRAARSLAGSLHRRGVGPGDVVVMQVPNWVEGAITFWAAAYLGATMVPVVHFYGAKEVEYILRVARPDVLVTVGRDRYGQDPAPHWLVVGENFEQHLDGEPIAGPLDADPDAAAVIGFTSGTTRDPKGVVHTHNTMVFESRHMERMLPVGAPPLITGTPIGHFMGMLNALVVPLRRGDPVNLVDVWDPGAVLRLMLEERLSPGGGATFFLTSLLDHPDYSAEHAALMPYAGLGGSTVPLAVTQRASDLGIQVFRSYGSTEHPSVTVGYWDVDSERKRMTTDGRPMEGVELRLDGDGQILTRGPDCFVGYTDPDLTAAVFDDEGWYRTGDVGELDEGGYLTITDRLADFIIRGGENISALEVEDALLGLPAIMEVAVVAAPDERLGERAAAVVRVRPGHHLPTLDEVREHLGSMGLAKQKWPESIHPVEDFPRTASGKVQKFRVRQALREGTLS
jgi:acyl-CoA synthetase (AMP-forming)/AMP-acid ligase II